MFGCQFDLKFGIVHDANLCLAKMPLYYTKKLFNLMHLFRLKCCMFPRKLFAKFLPVLLVVSRFHLIILLEFAKSISHFVGIRKES